MSSSSSTHSSARNSAQSSVRNSARSSTRSPRLVYRNAWRSWRENLIYFATLVTAVASFYLILALEKQDVIIFLREFESDAINKLLALMPALYAVALLLLFFLVLFANRYQLDQRSRELGLYLILGMPRWRLSLQLLAEGAVTSCVALVCGLAVGVLLGEVLSLAISRLVGQGIIGHQLSVSVDALGWTTLGFLLIQAIALLILGVRLFKREVNDLLHERMDRTQRRGSVTGNVATLVLGIACLAGAYTALLAAYGTWPLVAVPAALALGIPGTILTIRGLARLLALLAGASTHRTTRGLATFTLRQLQESIAHKPFSVTAASVLMMFSLMLIASGVSVVLGSGSSLSSAAKVYDFTIVANDQDVEDFLSSAPMEPYVAALNRFELGYLMMPLDWATLRERVVAELPAGSADPAIGRAEGDGFSIDANDPLALQLLTNLDARMDYSFVIPQSSYNRLLEAAGAPPLALGADEVGLYLNPDFSVSGASGIVDGIAYDAREKSEPLLSADGRPLYLAPTVPGYYLVTDHSVTVMLALIMPDALYDEWVNPSNINVFWSFVIPAPMQQEVGQMVAVRECSELLAGSGLQYESYLQNYGRQLFYIVAGSYTLLYMGSLFLIIACTVLALQFLTQMKRTRRRYLTLGVLGAGREQMRGSLYRQVLWYFLLPLLLACASGAVGIYVMERYFFARLGDNPLMLIVAFAFIAVFVVIVALYAFTVARTAVRDLDRLQWSTQR